MKHCGALLAALTLVLAMLACQSAAELPIPGGSSSSGEGGAASICSTQADLGLDFDLASQAPTCAADCTEIGPELGRDGAEALAAEFTPADTFCSYDVSPDTQAVIDQAAELESQGKTDEALALLAKRVQELSGQSAMGKAVSAPSRQSSGGRQTARDILAMGQSAALWGGDDEPFINSAQAAFRDFALQELPGADLTETMRIAEEAALLGLDDIEQQALDQARDIAEREYKEASASLDPCTVTKDALKVVMKKVQIAMLLGVPSANEDSNPAFANLLQTIMQAAAAVKNKESGGVIEGCKVAGELEISYSMFFSVGTDEPIVVTTSVPFSLDLTEEPPGYQTDTKLYTDEVFTFQDETVHDIVDFDVNLSLWYMGGATPLEVDLGIKGGSEFFFGVPIRSGTPDIDENVQLFFPLTEGATQEFDLEELKDMKEWKVTLHLTPGQ
jgi:hypothetical protein